MGPVFYAGPSVGILSAEPAVRDENHLIYDVVAESPSANLEPQLAVPRCDSFEFFDMMLPRPIVGILGKDRGHVPFGSIEITMALLQLSLLES